ncbi:hypothetical protein WJX84_010765 [Apatococcus fuscideae]|uniref:Uncharacterized protein n=1 Tax=Apatococcus fuscideae TaxID=2026836 RepID=A0AAW1SGZ1_9CHLO
MQVNQGAAPNRVNLQHGFLRQIVKNQISRNQYHQQWMETATEVQKEHQLELLGMRTDRRQWRGPGWREAAREAEGRPGTTRDTMDERWRGQASHRFGPDSAETLLLRSVVVPPEKATPAAVSSEDEATRPAAASLAPAAAAAAAELEERDAATAEPGSAAAALKPGGKLAGSALKSLSAGTSASRQRATAAATAATAEQPTAHKSSLADQSRALSLALGVASRPSTTGPATSKPPQHNAAPTHAAQAHSVSPSAFGKLVEPGNAQSPVEARHSVREPSHAAQQGRPSGFLQPTADGRPMEVIGSDVEYEMVTAEAEAAAAPEAPLRRAQGPANSLARQALRGALGGQRGIGAPARASTQAASPGPRATVDAAVPALGGQRGIGAPARPSPQAASPGSKAATDAAVQPTATPMHGSQHRSKIGTAADAADSSEPIGIHSKQHCSQMAADSSGTEPHGSSMRPASAAITHGAAPLAGPPSSAQSPAPGAPRAAPAGRRNPRRAPEASAALDTFATSRQEEAAAFQPDEAAPGTSGQASQDGRQATPAGRREKPAHRSRRQEGRPVEPAQPSSWSQTQDEWERDDWSATADAQMPLQAWQAAGHKHLLRKKLSQVVAEVDSARQGRRHLPISNEGSYAED